MLLADYEITQLCRFPDTAMIKPFFQVSKTTISHEEGHQCTPGLVCPSYGLTSAGYDIRVSDHWMFPDEHGSHEVYDTCREPGTKASSGVKFNDHHAPKFVLMPGKFTLAVSVESFKIPDDVLGSCMGKSTLARMGIMVIVTPLEPGWEGYLTLEIYNAGANPVALHAGMGICQINFHQTRETPHKSYMSRSGKYQDQPNAPVMARV